MVTHNPDLANEYATRIINLKDGKIIADSDPFDASKAAAAGVAAEADTAAAQAAGISAAQTAGASAAQAGPAAGQAAAKSAKKDGKASMSFLTALSLSFKNLMTKKGRTILVAFAGSIGIIGIALILSLSNGVNKYIDDVEEETLSEYPVQIQSTGFDLTSLMEAQNGIPGAKSSDEDGGSGGKSGAKDEMTEGDIGEIRTASEILSNSNTNDLRSFKKFLDSDESHIMDYASTVEYKYNVTPIIYRVDGKTRHARKVNPDETFAAVGIGGSSATSSSIMSYAMSTDSFFDMPEDEKTYKSQYEVAAGRWPENEHELVLVLTSSGDVSDLVLYMMGKKDPNELPEAIKDFVAGREVKIKDDELRFDYREMLGQKFHLVVNSDQYKYDAENGVYIDKSNDQNFMDKLAKKGETLKITGIVKPRKGAKALSLQLGIGYSPDLIKYVIDKTKDSGIVKAQLRHPEIDPLTGKEFGAKSEDDDFDMKKLFSIDEGMLKSAFNFDTGKLTLDPSTLSGEDLENIDLSGMSDGIKFDMTEKNMNKLFNRLAADYQKKQKGTSSDPTGMADGFSKYLTTPEAKMILAQIRPDSTEEEMNQIMMMLYGGYTKYAKENGLSNQDDIQTGFARYMNTPSAQNIINEEVAGMIDTSAAEKQLTRAIKTAVSSYMQKAMAQLSSGLENAMTIDPQAFANAIKVNMDVKDLEAMLVQRFTKGEATYESNMKDFGYADLTDPSMILIYPTDFKNKDMVTKTIDDYNDRMELAGEDDKVITYSDIVGTLMSSVTDIINQISMVLIAFVAISLVVSSIMIGVITYISVLERKKEIGILRAMGASKGNVANVFNAETFIIGLLAGVLGIVISLLLLIPGNQLIQTLGDGTELRARMPMDAAFILIALSVVLTLIGGWIPSRKAAKSDPVAALRTE